MRGMTNRRATLAKVAERAGVSIPTVSKVLNGRDDVSASTRERVQAALDDLDYEVPGRRGSDSSLGTRVVFVCESLSSAYVVEVLRGVVDGAALAGAEVVVSLIPRHSEDEGDSPGWAKKAAATHPTGIVLVTSAVVDAELAQLIVRGIPVVVIDPLSVIRSDYVSVGATNWAGGKTATDHLLSLGHRKIAYIGGPSSAECNVARLHGYLAALSARGITPSPDYLTGGDFTAEAGRIAARTLFDLDDRPTAIFAASDSIATGVFEIAAQRGISIPAELSVVGFDGTYLSEVTYPRLTTVAQPLTEMGQTAVRLVLNQARGERIDSDHIELATRLIERDSTRGLG